MIIKIGGIEINKLSNIKEVNQLRAGLDELGIDTPLEGLVWLKELSLEEMIDFISIVGDYGIDAVISFLTFGIF